MRPGPSRALLSALLVPALLLAACTSPGGASSPSAGATSEAKVTAEEVAENLLVALRDGQYEVAHEILSTGSARDYAADPASLQSLVETAGLAPTTWSLEPVDYDIDDAGNDRIVGTVTFADGSTGTVEITLTALGLSNDPWRVQGFRIDRD